MRQLAPVFQMQELSQCGTYRRKALAVRLADAYSNVSPLAPRAMALISCFAPTLRFLVKAAKAVLELFRAQSQLIHGGLSFLVLRYVREDDLHSFDYPDPARVAFAWESTPPSVSSGMGTVQIKDIRMRRVETNFQDTVLYYASIFAKQQAARRRRGSNSSQSTAFAL